MRQSTTTRKQGQRHSTSAVASTRSTRVAAPPPPEIQAAQVIFAVPPTQMFCFICNSSYWTTVNHTDVPDTSTARILTLCDLFSIKDQERQQMLRLACLSDPFCVPCLQKITQLQDWIAQLELLQKGIESLKADISVLMINSLTNSPDIEGTRHIKSEIVNSYKSTKTSPAKSKTSDAFQNLMLGGEKFLEVSPNTKARSSSDPTFETQEIIEEDGFFNQPELHESDGDGEADGAEELDVTLTTIEQQPPEEDPFAEVLVKPIEKERRRREPGVRIPRSEVIPAHPDGCCRLCPSTFKSQIQLSKHIRRKHSGITHPCRYCDRTFHDTSNRKRHEVSVHINTTRDYFCDRCGKNYKTTWMLKAHIRDTHEGIILKSRRKIDSQCDICGRVCTSLRNLSTHIRHNHRERGIVCSICARPFKDYQRKRQHEKTHLSPIELKELYGKTYYYKCEICPMEGQLGWKTKALLLEHYTKEHPGEKPKVPIQPPERKKKYFCKECPNIKGFTKKVGLDYHLKSNHGQHARQFYNKFGKECQICKKPCRDSTRAVLHQSTHFPRAYVCHLCIFTSYKIKLMVNHYALSHPDAEVPKFRSFRTLGIQRYFCPQCPERAGFSRKEKMRLHIQVRHTTKHKDKLENYVSPVEDEDDEDDDEVDFKEEKWDDEENSEEDFGDSNSKSEEDVKIDVKDIIVPKVSRSGRILKPSKRFQPSGRRLTLEKERRLQVRLERVDRKWPKGKVKRVKAIKISNSNPWVEEDEIEVKTEVNDTELIEKHPLIVEAFDYNVSPNELPNGEDEGEDVEGDPTLVYLS